VSKAIVGLAPNTTYHYRVVGQNVAGTTNGSDQTFTTDPVLATVTTAAATGIGSTGAALNGSVNANNASTTVTFEYGPDTNYGATVTADQSPVTGIAATGVSKAIAGLVPNTLYHYRAVGVNAAGTTYGNDLTFTTVAIPPTVTSTVATGIDSAGATLNGTVNANNADTAVTFEYGLDTSYGTTVTADQSPLTGIAATGVSKGIVGLAPNTTYHYRVVGQNVAGTTNGSDQTFTTDPVVATLTTTVATGIGSTGVTLNGMVNANNASTTATFEYGPDTTYGTTVVADQSPVTGTAATAVTSTISGLVPNTTYHYRVVGVNAAGTANGNDLTFITDAAPPVVTTAAATGIGSVAATLNGSINANNADTAVTFEYGLTASYGTIVTAGQNPVTGSADTAVTSTISGLAPNTTYHYRVVGVNVAGTTNGSDLTFTTDPVLATVGTTAATGISSTGATLNGTVNANNATTTVTFEYGPDTTYGTTVTANQSPVTGSSDIAVAVTLSGLAANTTYHYRVIGANPAGTTYGNDQTFTSLAVWSLTVAKTGKGDGTVTSNPAGIDCGNDSTEDYDHNTEVTLTATPDNFSRFTGWSGDADCDDGIVTMSGEVNCTANFYRFAWWLFFDVITRNPPQP
jgi:phosphodiesterase/alkaline phosphatase D-like protein